MSSLYGYFLTSFYVGWRRDSCELWIWAEQGTRMVQISVGQVNYKVTFSLLSFEIFWKLHEKFTKNWAYHILYSVHTILHIKDNIQYYELTTASMTFTSKSHNNYFSFFTITITSLLYTIFHAILHLIS